MTGCAARATPRRCRCRSCAWRLAAADGRLLLAEVQRGVAGGRAWWPMTTAAPAAAAVRRRCCSRGGAARQEAEEHLLAQQLGSRSARPRRLLSEARRAVPARRRPSGLR